MKAPKFFFFFGVLLVLFEWLRVYFIMPMPGSQRINSIDLAYFFHQYRWIIRMVCLLALIIGFRATFKLYPKSLIVLLLFLAGSSYVTNFIMSADQMFQLIKTKTFTKQEKNNIDLDRLIIGVEFNNEAVAYPVQIIAHHHQISDTVGGVPVLVTYCSVCRTARVFSPKINNKITQFRLVGMDHFNAMFEDPQTHSWWRQVNGTAVTGPLKGKKLKELFSKQITLRTWLEMHPDSRILQADPFFKKQYDGLIPFETGTSRSSLTGRDTQNGAEKNWMVWLSRGENTKSISWNLLEKTSIKVINDKADSILIVNNDGASVLSFTVQQNTSENIGKIGFKLDKKLNRLYIFPKDKNSNWIDSFALSGQALTLNTKHNLLPMQCYQEYNHSYHVFNSPNKIK